MSCYQRILVLLLCAWGGLAGLAFAGPGGSPKAQGQGSTGQEEAPLLVIERQGDRLSVRAQNAPWPAVLKALERYTGIPIHIKGALVGTLTQTFETPSLEQGLRQLFRDTNVIFFYEPGTKQGPMAETLTQVWLFPKDSGRAPAAARQAQLGSEERTSEEKIGEVISTVAGTKPWGEPVAEDDLEGRLSALQAFAEQGNVARLRQAIFDPNSTMQATALELIVERDVPDTIVFLRRMAKSDQPELRLQAIKLLHQIAQADRGTVLATLGEALADEDAAVKHYAIQALAGQREPDALRYLGQASHDPDPVVRQLVLDSILKMDQGLILLQEGTIGRTLP
jgi:hypothetical protein